ncbi:bifunctional 4-hydroxy-3-methylbut-2-enyl diphosphate reductase/30S ribosomal protein S1 [Halobacteroides halobius]|nr:bifunctional 4-hydroxy-3-methylbut-2-enyl diphosphate reductase/30S ribosomal protein S1 [Halobacteroides halobius]
MEIKVGERAGFCFGVDRAMDFALKEGKESKNSVHTLGPLIHNPQAVDKLKKADIKVIDQIDKVDDGTIIIRSHGVRPSIIEEAEDKDLDIINATCPFVQRVQEKAKQLYKDGYQVLISGDKDHPEVIGILGHTDNQAIVVEELSDCKEVKLKSKVGVVAQTTQSLNKLKKLVDYLLPQISDLKVHNTICTTTGQRQDEAARLAQDMDLMIVIGGYNSANTNRLAEICRENGAITHHIEQADELQVDWFSNIKKIGVTAGASTPNWIIKEVVSRMAEIKQDVEEKETTEESTTLTVGERVTGTIAQLTEDGAYIDIGAKTEGFIPNNEISSQRVASSEILSEGEEVEVEIVNPEGEDGHPILSKRKVDEEAAWAKVKEAYENEEIITAKVDREVKGGLVVNIGLRGFIPASHVAVDYVEDLSQFVGQELELKVIEVEEENNNVVLSRKAILEEELSKKKEEILNSLNKGDIVEGKVTKLVDFGAFVDLGGVEGLLHISEISWQRIEHPSKVLEEGQEIEVKVLEVNPTEERIALGYKQTQPDPWEQFDNKYDEGDKVTGKITKTVDFGAFMEVEPGVEGLIHISQLSHEHVANVEDVVTAGDEVEAEILNIDINERRVGLSIKELESAPASQGQPARQPKSRPNKRNNNRQQDKEKKNGTTIGDLVGDDLEDLFS